MKDEARNAEDSKCKMSIQIIMRIFNCVLVDHAGNGLLT